MHSFSKVFVKLRWHYGPESLDGALSVDQSVRRVRVFAILPLINMKDDLWDYNTSEERRENLGLLLNVHP